MKAILYCRVSTEEQVESGLSLSAQESLLIEECTRRGISDFIVIRDEGISGKTMKRPGIQQAMGLLQDRERNLLMVAKLDRCSRSPSDLYALASMMDRQGWQFVSLDRIELDSTTVAGKATWRVMALMSEIERDLASERTASAFSFKRSRGDAGLIPIEVEDRIISLYRDEKLSQDRIAKRLNAEGVPTARGGKWAAMTVWRVIERRHPQDRVR